MSQYHDDGIAAPQREFEHDRFDYVGDKAYARHGVQGSYRESTNGIKDTQLAPY